MKRLFHIIICTILLTACCVGVVFSQIVPPDLEMQRLFFEELQITQADIDAYNESLLPLVEEMQRNIQTKVMAELPGRMAEAYANMTPEAAMRLGVEHRQGIAMDEMIAMQPKFKEKSNEAFSEEQNQKMQLRTFQMKEGLMERLDSMDNPEAIQGTFGMGMMQLMGGQPDFLDLSPEQKDLLLTQQKKTSIEAMTLMSEASMKVMADPAKREQMRRLGEEMQKAETDEQRAEIGEKMQKVSGDVMKEIAPQLKKLMKDEHESFLRTLTDAQRAKIKTVMAEMPDYMKKGFEKFDKDGTGFGNLDSWVPGSGVPGMPNPNREAPRQREGGREFPN